MLTEAVAAALVSNDICGTECIVTSPGTITIRDSEFDGTAAPLDTMYTACAFRGVGVLERNYMHGMEAGICFFGTGFIHDAIAERNLMTNLVNARPESHREGATIRDFRITQRPNRVARFTDNRMDCSGGNCTGGLFIQPTWEDIYNLTVEGNYFEGNGYNLYLEEKGGTYGNVRSINNRFRPTGWGPSATIGPGWDEWRDNYRYDATQPDGKGAVVNP